MPLTGTYDEGKPEKQALRCIGGSDKVHAVNVDMDVASCLKTSAQDSLQRGGTRTNCEATPNLEEEE